MQPQAQQQTEGAKDGAASQAGGSTLQVQSQTTAALTAGKDAAQQVPSNPLTQATTQAAVPSAELWYQQQQQYQQYYQHYPGYNQYQQYYPYQLQAVAQYQQPVQAQSQGYVQPQPQTQLQGQLQTQGQPQSQPQPQMQPAHPPAPAPVAAQPPNQVQVNPQLQPQSYSQTHGQAQPFSQPMQVPQNQQPQIQQAMPQPQPLPQTQLQTQSQHHLQPQSQSSHQPHPPPQNIQSQTQHTAANAVTGHQSYPQSQPLQQNQLVNASAQMQVPPHVGTNLLPQNQFTQHNSQMRPSQSLSSIQNQHQPTMLPPQGQPQQPLVHSSAQQTVIPPFQRPGMQPVHQHYPQHSVGAPYQPSPLASQQTLVSHQLRSQAPQFQQHSHAYVQSHQSHQNVTLMPGMQPQVPHGQVGRPVTPIHGLQSQSYPQPTTGQQVRPSQLGANQPSADHGSLLWNNNQMQLSSELQSGVTTKPVLTDKQEMAERNVDGREGGSSTNDSKKAVNNLEALFISQSDAVGSRIQKNESDKKLVDSSKKEFVTNFENAEVAAKLNMREETREKVDGPKDFANIGEKPQIESNEVQDGGGDKSKPQAPGIPDGPGVVQSSPNNYGSSTQQKSSTGTSVFHAPHPGLPHPTNASGSTQFGTLASSNAHPGDSFQSAVFKPHSPEQSSGVIPSAVSAAYGRGPGYPPHGFEPPSVPHQGPYNQGPMPPSHIAPPKLSPADPAVGGPLLCPLAPGAFDSQGRAIAGGTPYGLENHMAQQHRINPQDAEMLLNQRPGYVDGRQPKSLPPGSLERGPLGQPSAIQANMMRMNGAPGPELQNERLKPFPGESLNPFWLDPSRPVGRGDFEEDLKQFPRSSRLDPDPMLKLGSKFPSSRPLDRGSHGFGMDMGPRFYDRELSDSAAGSAPSRYFSLSAGDRSIGIHDGTARRSESARAQLEYHGQGPGYGRRHMDGLSPRSPISSGGFGGLHGSVGSNHSSQGYTYKESRLALFQSQLRGGEFDGPGRSSDFVGPEFLPSHLERGGRLGPHSLRFGEVGSGFGRFPGPDIAGSRNFPRPQLGEPGFRSSFTHQGFPNDGGIFTVKNLFLLLAVLFLLFEISLCPYVGCISLL